MKSHHGCAFIHSERGGLYRDQNNQPHRTLEPRAPSVTVGKRQRKKCPQPKETAPCGMAEPGHFFDVSNAWLGILDIREMVWRGRWQSIFSSTVPSRDVFSSACTNSSSPRGSKIQESPPTTLLPGR